MKLKKREVDKMTLEQYMRELWLMNKQYGQEIELYPLINMLLRADEDMKNLSIRDVHNGRKTVKRDHRKYIDGFGSFPDLAIFDESFPNLSEKNSPEEENIVSNLQKIYGCVEVKCLGQKLVKCLDNLGGNAMKISQNEKNYYCVQINTEKGTSLNRADGGATSAGQLLGELLWYGKVLYTDGLIWKYYKLSEDSGKINNKRKGYIKLIDKNELPQEPFEYKTWIFEQCKADDLKITITSEEIGNLTDIYQEIKKENKEKEKFEQKWEALKDKKGFEQRWNDFKEKLAEIKWNEDVFTNAETKSSN